MIWLLTSVLWKPVFNHLILGSVTAVSPWTVAGKSESIVFHTSSCIHNFLSVPGANIASTLVSDKIVTLGVTLDHHLALSRYTSNVCRAAKFHIPALYHIRASLTEDMAKTVAVSVVHSRLDYANSVVHGRTNIKRLQSVQNSAARVVLKNNPNLSSRELLLIHWLPIQSRIEFNIVCITYTELTTSKPTYLRMLT